MSGKIPRGHCTVNVAVSNEGVGVAVYGFALPENAVEQFRAVLGDQAVFAAPDLEHFTLVLRRNQDWVTSVRPKLKALLAQFAREAGASDLKIYYRIKRLSYEDDTVVFV